MHAYTHMYVHKHMHTHVHTHMHNYTYVHNINMPACEITFKYGMTYCQGMIKFAWTQEELSEQQLLGECIALWGGPNELSIQYHVYIFMQYVDSKLAKLRY